MDKSAIIARGMPVDPQRFAHLTFDRFRALALEPDLTRHERIGFPNAYREDKTGIILADIAGKLTHLDRDRMRVLDIGPGCGDLALALIDRCQARHHELFLIDSPEMLGELPARAGVTKVPGRFPEECRDLLRSRPRGFDVILIYSVLQYVVDERDPVSFVDAALDLLDRGGQMLIGDIPNRSKRERVFSAPPLHSSPIDDDMVIGLVRRARAAGVDAYLMPQAPALPMANRRDDVLFIRP